LHWWLPGAAVAAQQVTAAAARVVLVGSLDSAEVPAEAAEALAGRAPELAGTVAVSMAPAVVAPER
jgi:hypothetical protein